MVRLCKWHLCFCLSRNPSETVPQTNFNSMSLQEQSYHRSYTGGNLTVALNPRRKFLEDDMMVLNFSILTSLCFLQHTFPVIGPGSFLWHHLSQQTGAFCDLAFHGGCREKTYLCCWAERHVPHDCFVSLILEESCSTWCLNLGLLNL